MKKEKLPTIPNQRFGGGGGGGGGGGRIVTHMDSFFYYFRIKSIGTSLFIWVMIYYS